jgi:hypothetical protein
MSLSTKLKGLWPFAKAKGSVFLKLAESDLALVEARGRIIAIDLAHKAKHEEAAVLEAEAARVHQAAAALRSRIEGVLALL